MGARLDWRGDEILKAARQAQVEAIDDATEDAVAISRGAAPVDTGFLRDHILPIPARRGRRGASGGVSSEADYTLEQELEGPNRGFLRQGADQAFPQLHGHLRRRWQQRAPR